jgi:hypothetical protein
MDRGELDESRHASLEALVDVHLRSPRDPVASLAAVGSLGSLREDLGRLDDPDLQAGLAATAYRRATGVAAKASYAPSSRRAGERFRIFASIGRAASVASTLPATRNSAARSPSR